MSRYIDADALKERLIQNIALTNAIDRSFSEAPSIDIVFCEDCLKHKVVPFGESACFYWCDFHCHAVNADDFCSFGESKEGE